MEGREGHLERTVKGAFDGGGRQLPKEKSMKWAVRTLTIFMVLCQFSAGLPAIAQTGWILIVPPFDQTFMKNIGALTSIMEEPSEEKRIQYLSKMPSEDFDQMKEFVERLDREPSIEKRYKLLIESLIKKKAPMGEWGQLKAFDSAKSCEDWKMRSITLMRDKEKRLLAEITSESLQVLSGLARVRAGRCVPASVIYPPNR